MNEKINILIKSKYKYVAILMAGVLCVVFSMGTSESNLKHDNLEEKLKNTLELAEGVGDVDVMLSLNSENQVEGAIIVAEGAGNMSVKKILHDSAVAVLGLPDYKVQVLIKKK